MQEQIEARTPIRIDKLARVAGITVDAIRFYEREQLIEPRARSSSGYRLYDGSAIERLRFIRRAQSLGFSLADVRELIRLGQDADSSCEKLTGMFRDKIELLNKKIQDLKDTQAKLKELLGKCDGTERAAHCGSLAHLLKDRGEG